MHDRSRGSTWWLIGGGLALVAGGLGWATARSPRLAPARKAFVEQLHALEGVAYIWGGKDPSKGLDCSGAVTWALEAVGLGSLRGSNSDALYRKSSLISEKDTLPGDLAFYGSPTRITHVMVVSSPGKVIGSTGGDSTTTSAEAAAAKGAGVKVKATNYRGDLVAFGRLPNVPV